MSSFSAHQQDGAAVASGVTLPVGTAEPSVTPSATALDPSGMSLGVGLFRECRPKQWIKNLLVLTAPLASGTIDQRSTLAHVAVSFVAFCLAASAVYYANDALDVEADRAHPTKRFRPIAAGVIPMRLAWVCVVVLSAASLIVAVADNGATLAVIAVYLAMHLSYSAWLKHVLVLDLALVAGGFLLRAMVGGVSANIPLSQWFLLTTGFGSLFMVAGKRYSELVLMGEGVSATRKALAGYSLSYLRFVWQSMARSDHPHLRAVGLRPGHRGPCRALARDLDRAVGLRLPALRDVRGRRTGRGAGGRRPRRPGDHGDRRRVADPVLRGSLHQWALNRSGPRRAAWRRPRCRRRGAHASPDGDGRPRAWPRCCARAPASRSPRRSPGRGRAGSSRAASAARTAIRRRTAAAGCSI